MRRPAEAPLQIDPSRVANYGVPLLPMLLRPFLQREAA
jgi:hypothetical protein